ncbi:outer membrane protein assembly factor BamB [Variovorax sp. PCZ-1]|uniref:outer membrane protein assembly factor BamB n=1 Tax=Variovorax sp. PCZ-1 TaxID=2835533 RepID=UPI001BD0AE38|nr:outer membrane protein assembly factor BamB [Variovorax sp. PCZ-1]MBS7808508.1 outer membrane protein assembly factor BamB [Variovorax sp. PCZ-1]
MSLSISILKPFKPFAGIESARSAILLVASAVLLSACSGGSKRPEPAPLAANVPLIGVKQAWANRIGEVPAGASPFVAGNTIVVASADGTVAAIDASNGRDIWRASAGAAAVTGAGTDGKLAAVVTRDNEVVALEAGKQLWKAKLPAQAFTAPFVAGARVFVLLADRSVHAFDGASGKKLWANQRSNTEPLVLSKAGTILAVGDTLVVGQGGRLVGINPGNGSVRWEAPIASPRGTNDIERLVDLVGSTSRIGDVVCARAYQAAVGCVNASRGTLLWNKPANGAEGIHGDSSLVVGSEADGKLIAWRRADGQQAWQTERLAFRTLSAPLMVGRSVVVGDNNGNLHMLSREDGSPLNRLTTDGSAIIGNPVLAGDSLVAVTKSGGVFGFRPE